MNTVWIGRPRRRAIALARELRKHNLSPLIKPAIRLAAAANDNFHRLLTQPHFYDLAIFVSEESARRCRHCTETESPIPALAVGRAAQAAAESLPICAPIHAHVRDGDSLLQLPRLRARQLAKKKIVITGGISGDNIRSLAPQLCRELQRRGAEVFPAVAYRRIPAPPDDILAAQIGETICAAVAYSGETARCMAAMVGAQKSRLLRLPLFVSHPNIAASATKTGFCDVRIVPPEAESAAARIAAQLRQNPPALS